MNPSTDDIVRAVDAVPAETVFVLPNNKNIIMAAEQAARLGGGQKAGGRADPNHSCRGFPRCSPPIWTASRTAASRPAMAHAAAQVRSGQATDAARDSEFDGKENQTGRIPVPV